MRYFKVWAGIASLCAGLLLGGCGDSGGDSDKLTDAEAKAAAMSSLAGVLNTIYTAVNSVNATITESAGMKVVAKTGLIDLPVSDAMKNKIAARYRAVVDRSAARVKSTRSRIALHGGATGGGMDDTHEGPVDADELEAFLVLKSQSGNTFTWGINDAVACDALDAECKASVAKITLVQTVVTDTSGTLAIQINGHTLITLGYATKSIYFEFDLAELKELLESEGDAGFDNVGHFAGKIRLTLTVNDDTEGQEAVTIALGIPEAIDIEGTDQGENVSLHIAASQTVLGLSADAGDGTATIQFGLGTVDMLYVDDQTLELMHAYIGGLTGTFVIDAHELVATNVGIGNEIYSDSGNDGSKEERMLLDAFGFTVDIVEGTITLDQALDLTVADAAGSLRVEAPQGTVLIPHEGNITEVAAVGPVVFTGTGDISGSLTTSVDECYYEDEAAVGFPFSTATCPAPL